MDVHETWKTCFCNWPAEVERHGIVVTNFGEQIPFDNFSTSETLLMLDRRTPDTTGARKVLLPYQHILGLKITDVVKTKAFAPLGFEEVRSKKTGV